MKTIVVLGSRGMLGQMVIKYFKKLNYSIIEFNERIDESNIFNAIKTLNDIEDAVIINCIGKIKQKSSDAYTLLFSNSILPMELNRSLKSTHFLIQPSTDCVFSGSKTTNYHVSDYNDAEDGYGWSKSLGEHALQHRSNTLIIRVSIIGPDNQSDKGLLSWFLNLPVNSQVNGFTNHFWNGITTLEWCKFVENYITSANPQKYKLNTIQLGTNEINSKHDMLKMFNDVFEKSIIIKPFGDSEVISKCLEPDLISPSLLAQLKELKEFID